MAHEAYFARNLIRNPFPRNLRDQKARRACCAGLKSVYQRCVCNPCILLRQTRSAVKRNEAEGLYKRYTRPCSRKSREVVERKRVSYFVRLLFSFLTFCFSLSSRATRGGTPRCTQFGNTAERTPLCNAAKGEAEPRRLIHNLYSF